VTKVVYVMGAGRSGSTLLGVMLDNCRGLFYAGELDAWLRRGGRPNDGREAVREFWGDVAEAIGPRDVDLLLGETCWIGLEHSAALVKPRIRRMARRLIYPYRRFNRALFDAIARTAGVSTVIDSSHYPLRALELRRTNGLDVFIIMLVRDPQGVIASFRSNKSQGEKRVLAANAYLWLTHALGLAVYLTHPRSKRAFVRYEDLLANPARTVDRIIRMVGEGGPPPSLSTFRVGKAFQGNRLLQAETVELHSLRPALASRSTLTSLVQLPWSVAFSALASTQR